MPLCVQRACGCALTSSSLVITGDGSPGSPWNVEGGPIVMTEAVRSGLAGSDLWEGKTVWTSDANRLWVYDALSATWLVISEPPQTWTPVITQSVTVTNTPIYAWYQRSNGVMQFSFRTTCTSAGTAANSITGSFPAGINAVTQTDPIGSFLVTHAGTNYAGTVIYPAAGVNSFRFVTDTATSSLGANPNIALANGDAITATVTTRYA